MRKPQDPERIALGLDIGRLLDDFAELHDAATWGEWPGDDWKAALVRIMNNGETIAFWNLTQVRVEEGLLRALMAEAGATTRTGAPVASNTDHELFQFKTHPDWWPRSRFFLEGEEVSNPFGGSSDA